MEKSANGQGLHDRFTLTLILLSAVFVIVFFSLRVQQYRSFFSFEWEDDGSINQVAYNIAVSNTPYQTMDQIDPPKIFNGHFSPFYYFIALFYRVYPHIYTWYFLMCFTYAFSSLIIYNIAFDFLRSKNLAFLIAIIYLFYPPLHYTTLGVIDPRNYLLPIFFLVFYFLYRRNFGGYLACMALACFCKEDVPLYFFGFTLYQIFKKYPSKWWVTTGVFSWSYLALAIYLTSRYCQIKGPQQFGVIDFDYINFINIKAVLQSFLSFDVLVRHVFVWFKLRLFYMTLFPLLFLPLFAKEFYIAFFILFIEVCIPDGFYNQNSDYVAPLIPFLFISLVTTLNRIKSKYPPRYSVILCLLIFFACIYGIFSRNIIGLTSKEYTEVYKASDVCEWDNQFLNVNNIFDKRFYTVSAEDEIAWSMLNLVPEQASLTVSGDLFPAASSRRYVYEFGLNNPLAYENASVILRQRDYTSEYVLINQKCLMNKLGGHYAWFAEKDLKNEIQKLLDEHHFRVIDKKASFILFRKI